MLADRIAASALADACRPPPTARAGGWSRPWPAARHALGALLLLGVAACAPGGGADTPEGTTPALLAARLPATVAGFERGAAAPLAGRDGIEVPFNTRGVPAAAAIVQLVPATGDPADTAPTEAALASLVREAMQSRVTRRVRDRGPRFTLPAGGPSRVICAETEGTLGRERVEGLLCAGRFVGSIAQIRVTMPQRSPPPADARAFASGIGTALATVPGGMRVAAPAQPPVGPPVLGAAGAR